MMGQRMKWMIGIWLGMMILGNCGEKEVINKTKKSEPSSSTKDEGVVKKSGEFSLPKKISKAREGSADGGELEGDGSALNPYRITNAEGFELVRSNLSRHFIVMREIDLSGVTNFNPIGRRGVPFEGTFDGGGKVINNLTIDRSTESSVGLFGYITRRAIVKNVKLKGVNVKGGDNVGAIVGYSRGTILDSDITGSVVGSAGNVGGIAGYSSGRIGNSYAVASVTGGSTGNVGGIVGNNWTGTVQNSYATGEVTGVGGSDIGGLVGENDSGTIQNSYAMGELSGRDNVGGLVGNNLKGWIQNSYATGDVVATGRNGGGLLGFNDSMEVGGKNYWQTGGLAKQGVGSGIGTSIEGKTENELKELDATETEWDSEIWEFEAGEYPKLAWQD